MCSSDCISEAFNEDGLNQLLNMVNNIDVAKINKKQRDSEEEAVLDLIRAGPGIEEVNGWVKDWVQDCLVDEICGEQKIVSMEDVDRLCSQVAPILMQSGGYNQAFRLFQKSLTRTVVPADLCPGYAVAEEGVFKGGCKRKSAGPEQGSGRHGRRLICGPAGIYATAERCGHRGGHCRHLHRNGLQKGL